MEGLLLVLEHFVLTCVADTLRAGTLRKYMENAASALEMLDEMAWDGMSGAGGEADPLASVRTAIHIRSMAEM